MLYDFSWGLRKVLKLHVSCLMFSLCNVYIHKMLNSFYMVYLGTFGKLRFDFLEKK